MSKKDNFYLIILSLVLMMFRPATTTIITTRSLVDPFIYPSQLPVSIESILIRIDKFLAFFGVLLFFYLSIVLLLKVFRKESA